MPELPTIAERLRSLRALRKLKQQELADMAGTTARTLGSWESGTTEPSASHIVALCAALKVSADYLLGRSDNENGLAPGLWIVDLDAIDRPRTGESWCVRIPRRPRVVDDDERARIERNAANEGKKSIRREDGAL